MSDIEALPAGWAEIKLGDAIPYGETDKAEPTEIASDAWVIELEDIEKSTSRLLRRVLFSERQSKSTKNIFAKGDVLYGKLRPYLNKVLIADRDGYSTTEIVPLKSNPAVHNRFLYYWLRHPKFLEYVAAESHGINMPRLGTDAGRNAPFILAPLAEQKRIADKLDALLARVDACRERLDRVTQSLKRFRQSALAAAVEGRLTEDWREGNKSEATLSEERTVQPEGDFCDELAALRYVIPLGWKWSAPKLIKASTDHALSIGPFGSNLTVKDYRETGVPLVFVRDIKSRNFGNSNTRFVEPNKAAELWAHRVEPGDILITKMGDPPGDATIFPNDRPVSIITSDCIRFQVDNSITYTPWVMHFVNSGIGRALIRLITAGVAQQKVSLQRFRDLPIPLPSLPEQHEIVRRVEAIFAIADRLEARVAAAQARAEMLTPALLAKAFRGQLVPQDPNDEPACELLARVREAQPTAATTAKRRRRAEA